MAKKINVYVVNNHLNNLYVLSNKAVEPKKNTKLMNVRPTSIPEARVCDKHDNKDIEQLYNQFSFVLAHCPGCDNGFCNHPNQCRYTLHKCCSFYRILDRPMTKNQ